MRNALTAGKALEVLAQRGFPVTEEEKRRGFAKAFLPARMEILSARPLCLLDGGHNPGCAAALKDALERFVPQRKAAIIGMMADKDSHEALRLVAPLFSKIVTLAPENPRSLPAEDLARVAGEFCPPGSPRPDLRGGHRPGHEGPGAGGRPHRLRVLLPGGGDPGTAEGQAGEFAVVTGFPQNARQSFCRISPERGRQAFGKARPFPEACFFAARSGPGKGLDVCMNVELRFEAGVLTAGCWGRSITTAPGRCGSASTRP